MSMKKFWEFFFHGPAARARGVPLSPIAAESVNAAEVLSYPLFMMCMKTQMKLDRCLAVLEEIRDLGYQPITMEQRIAIKECLREIEKREERYATDR